MFVFNLSLFLCDIGRVSILSPVCFWVAYFPLDSFRLQFEYNHLRRRLAVDNPIIHFDCM